jgi:hypothetical protein
LVEIQQPPRRAGNGPHEDISSLRIRFAGLSNALPVSNYAVAASNIRVAGSNNAPAASSNRVAGSNNACAVPNNGHAGLNNAIASSSNGLTASNNALKNSSLHENRD